MGRPLSLRALYILYADDLFHFLPSFWQTFGLTERVYGGMYVCTYLSIYVVL